MLSELSKYEMEMPTQHSTASASSGNEQQPRVGNVQQGDPIISSNVVAAMQDPRRDEVSSHHDDDDRMQGVVTNVLPATELTTAPNPSSFAPFRDVTGDMQHVAGNRWTLMGGNVVSDVAKPVLEFRDLTQEMQRIRRSHARVIQHSPVSNVASENDLSHLEVDQDLMNDAHADFER